MAYINTRYLSLSRSGRNYRKLWSDTRVSVEEEEIEKIQVFWTQSISII